MSVKLRLAVVGAGRVGGAVGRHWLTAGHTVRYGSRDPEVLRLALAGAGPDFAEWLDSGALTITTSAEAVEGCAAALLAVPAPAVPDTLLELGNRLAGKVVIDATNPVSLSANGFFVSDLPAGLTEGRAMADRLPASAVVRAFTHVMDELLWARGTDQPGLWGMAVAGDDAEAKVLVERLVVDTGFVPVDLGGLDDSAPLDPGGELFPHMFTAADLCARLRVAVS